MIGRYVIVTAAKDEAELIGEVIERVAAQTVLPLLWLIVDDGSTDRTAEIVSASAARHPWIRLSSSGEREGRNFGSQYKAIQAGCASLRHLDFDYLAVQDADQAPGQPEYYERALQHLQDRPGVGMVSGLVVERADGQWTPRASNAPGSTAGSVVFRRACFEGMGGYSPLVHGGSDWLAQLRARMAGWQVETLPGQRLLHYRPSSSAGGLWRGRFREGLMDASFQSHPLFELLKCARRLSNRPAVLGAVVRLAGYLYGALVRRERALSRDEAAFLRREQVAKMRRWMARAGWSR